MSILWCITGGGEHLKESFDIFSESGQEIDVIISAAGKEVLTLYGLYDRLASVGKIREDLSRSSISMGKVSLGHYNKIIVAPASGNTIAKIACGIADNIVTTAISLAIKAKIPCYVLPTDIYEGEKHIPNNLVRGGETIYMRPRKSDLRNLKHISEEGVGILNSPAELKGILDV